ncbi:hypothetical protein NC651_009736 [Populus alba x Populus x berolinensis]|nr:hypothetical protein NC651_009736 [Populus alba x Populus x berolinensis]
MPFVHSFEIDSPLTIAPITVTVEYEWKPTSCDQCKVFGHSCKLPTPPIPEDKDNLPTAPNTITTVYQPITTIIPPQTSPAPEPTPPVHNPDLHCNPSSPKLPTPVPQTHSITPQPQVQPLPLPTINIAIPTDMEDCDSSQDSGNEPLDIQPHHINTLHATICLESKMDSLRSTSESSFVGKDISAEASTSAIPTNADPMQSPVPSPTTTRKKKGGRKKKEARGH